jgi:hypothetical protein
MSTSSSSGRYRKRKERGSSRRADFASRQQRDHFFGNRTQESLPFNALEDSGQDEDDWNQGGDDNAHTEFPDPISHLSTVSVGLEVEGYTLLQSQVDYYAPVFFSVQVSSATIHRQAAVSIPTTSYYHTEHPIGYTVGDSLSAETDASA